MSKQASGGGSGVRDLALWIVYAGIFAVPFLTTVVMNDFFFPFITGKNFGFRIIVEVIFASWIILALLDAQYRPRFSWLLAGFSTLLAVMALATLLGEHPATSFWSNYERMDGYITLLHVFAYFLVVGCTLQTPRVWSYFLHWSLAVAVFVALRGVSQLSDGVGRIDSTLGNAAYMAVYMLFHIFFVAYLFMQTKVTPYRVVYALIGVFFIYVLLQTGTRGTALGLAAGSVASVAYIALFATRAKQYRTYALGALAFLVLLGGSFVVARDSDFVQSNDALSRIANIDLGEDLRIRSIIWQMSLAGVAERPLLGWGPSNFNYVFNEQYDPRLFAQEQWFDRVHNIIFDWLIAGGIFGLLAYLSIFVAIAYYLLWLPWRGDERFTVLERGVLFGLVVGYFTHNLVVFDNIVSYIFFGSLLALIHSRVATPMARVEGYQIAPMMVTQFVAPIVLVVTAFGVYFLNVPGIQAAQDLIVGFRTQNWEGRLAAFEQALDRGSFARQEIVEQLAQQTMEVVRIQDVPDAIKQAFATRSEAELQRLVDHKPGDARLHVFFASYYRALGESEKALEQFALAREFSPRKQQIILQEGATVFNTGDIPGARDRFREAFELDEENEEARQFLLAAYFYNEQIEEGRALYDSATDRFRELSATNDFVIGAVNAAEQFDILADFYEVRVARADSNPQNWASLAFVYYQLGDVPAAVDALERASVAVPAFAGTAACISANIQAGRAPQEGCN